jgi:hypothetical protein
MGLHFQKMAAEAASIDHRQLSDARPRDTRPAHNLLSFLFVANQGGHSVLSLSQHTNCWSLKNTESADSRD